jgi:hypothetical protein
MTRCTTSSRPWPTTSLWLFLPRFHFCRAFKESTGLSPHAWLHQHRLKQAMNMLRDTDAPVVSVANGAWLCVANRFRRGIQENDRRNPKRLAEAHTLAAISRQVRQSLWGSHRFGPLDKDHRGAHADRRQTMAWKNLIGPRAITSRRRVVASALMYGLSLTVRFTSTTGEEVENPAQAAQTINPLLSIMIKDGVPISRDWPPKHAHSIVFQRAPSLSSRGCRTTCERPMPIPLMPDCSPP